MEKLGLFCTVGKSVKWCSCYGKQYGGSQNVTELSHDPAIPLLGKVSRRIESNIRQITVCMFVATLFTIAKANVKAVWYP